MGKGLWMWQWKQNEKIYMRKKTKNNIKRNWKIYRRYSRQWTWQKRPWKPRNNPKSSKQPPRWQTDRNQKKKKNKKKRNSPKSSKQPPSWQTDTHTNTYTHTYKHRHTHTHTAQLCFVLYRRRLLATISQLLVEYTYAAYIVAYVSPPVQPLN